MSNFNLYQGQGLKLSERNMKLGQHESPAEGRKHGKYIASQALRDAVNVAIALGQPLLLTGEPGTGKTQLAYSVAYELELGTPLIFNTKTDSGARDLFYRYDSLGHFHQAQMGDKAGISIKDFIKYEALGQAIINSEQNRSVVLIDEIDKAPRDLPNDVLNEFENMEFMVRETGEHFSAKSENRPILVLTSNSEKNLPDAFLRRVVYFHIPFPDKETLYKIVQTRIQLSTSFTDQMLKSAIDHFVDIRKNRGLQKRPATAELLAWVHILDKHGINPEADAPDQIKQLAMTYSILAKNKDDRRKLMGS